MKLTKKDLESRMVKGKIMLPNMKITEIEAFPKKVKEIYLDGNRLCYLPEIPKGCEVIIMRGNPLHEEPNLPDSVKCADFTNTCLEDEIYFDVRIAHSEVFINEASAEGDGNEYKEPEEDYGEEDDIIQLLGL